MGNIKDKTYNRPKDLVTESQKRANGFRWYKEYINFLDQNSFRSREHRDSIQGNYDLYNDKLNLNDFNFVLKSHGGKKQIAPETLKNQNIFTPKIKKLLGLSKKRSNNIQIVAINKEATTRKEAFTFNGIKESVESRVMLPLRTETEAKYMQEVKGRELSEEEMAELEQRIAQETEAKTPEEVIKYSKEEHQDPVEIMSNQLLTYFNKKLDMREVYSSLEFHMYMSGFGSLYLGVVGGELVSWPINSRRFDYSRSPDQTFIQDSEWAVAEYYFTPSQIVKMFGKEMNKKDIEAIYRDDNEIYESALHRFLETENGENFTGDGTTRVIHAVWRSFKGIQFLKYIDEEGEEQMDMVDSSYKLNEERGDISLDKQWIVTIEQGWKVRDKFYELGPLENQLIDLDTPSKRDLPFYGVITDNVNSDEPMALATRMKYSQYLYTALRYKAELKLGASEGKKVIIDPSLIPEQEGISREQWLHFFKLSPVSFVDTKKEGVQGELGSMVKEIDLSLGKDISELIQWAEYVRTQMGRSVGITDAVEGHISEGEAVRNSQQNLANTSDIIELYFQLIDSLKKKVSLAIIENAKILYHGEESVKLAYVTDDMTQEILNLDVGLLQESKFGLFAENATKVSEVKEELKQLSHAAMQAGSIDLSNALDILESDSIAQGRANLQAAEEMKRKEVQNTQAQQAQQAQALEKFKRDTEMEKLKFERETKVQLAKIKQETDIIKSGFMAASFNPGQDKDGDGANDFLEEARLELSKRQQDHSERMDERKSLQEDKKLEIEKEKIKSSVKN